MALANLCVPGSVQPGMVPSLTQFWGKVLRRPRELAPMREALCEAAMAWAWLEDESRDVVSAAARGHWGLVRLDPALVTMQELESLARCAGEARSVDLMAWAARAAAADDVLVRRAGERSLLTLALWSVAQDGTHETIEGFAPLRGASVIACSPHDAARIARELVVMLDAGGAGGSRGAAISVIIAMHRHRLREHPAFARALASDDPATSAVLGALRSASWAISRERAWEWLGLVEPAESKRLAHACAARLSRTKTPSEHAMVLRLAHLALAPRRALGMARVVVRGARRSFRVASVARVPAMSALPQAAVLRGLHASERRELPRFARTIGADTAMKVAACEPLLADDDPAVRMALVRHAPSQLLGDLALDRHPSVASAAAVRAMDELTERGSHAAEDRGAACSLAARCGVALHARSPHSHVRALAKLAGDGLGASFASQQTRARLWAWLREDREAAVDFVRAGAQSCDDHDAIGALQLARRMGIADELLEHAQRILARDARDEGASPIAARVVATAVSMLGGCTSEGAWTLLQHAARHRDDRVRANAIDALFAQARRHPGRRGELAPLLDDLGVLANTGKGQPHRVRGSAVRAMLVVDATQEQSRRSGDAGDALDAMLRDARAEHRLAGVWVLGRVRSWMGAGMGHDWLGVRASGSPMSSQLPVWRASIDEMSVTESHEHVRRRAAACGALLVTAGGVA